MHEKNVSESFANTFKDLQVWTASSAQVAGWPDRFIQLPNSRFVAVELKLFRVNKTGYFNISTFRGTQAAWFAKWQRAGGLCCIFFGLVNWARVDYRLGFITVKDWREWLTITEHKFVPYENIKIYKTLEAIRADMQAWFTRL